MKRTISPIVGAFSLTKPGSNPHKPWSSCARRIHKVHYSDQAMINNKTAPYHRNLANLHMSFPKDVEESRELKNQPRLTYNFKKSIIFSILLIISGSILGPFLDSYHSAFGVLQYHSPISWKLWGGETHQYPPAFTTTWWVPPLFGLAGFIIGWMYVLFDASQTATSSFPLHHSFFTRMKPQFHCQMTVILMGISCFTFQYWLSGYLFANTLMSRSDIFIMMTLYAISGYLIFDRTSSGLITSVATAFGGPLIEMFIIHYGRDMTWGYEYTDGGETGFFPLWILPVYFLGGPAVGNLARGIWKSLEEK